MSSSDSTYDDISDILVLDITSRIVGELRSVLEGRHIPNVVQALQTVQNEAEFAQRELALNQGRNAKAQSAR